jgi:soluble lytic murein transglycosylase-like protein
MSILSEIKQQKHSLDDLAKLPQSMIMQMAQRKQIMPEMVAPILSRKAEMMEAVAKTKALQSVPQGMVQPTVMESLMARNVQPPQRSAPPMAQPMAQPPQQSEDMSGLGQMSAPPQFAGGGIVAFAEGDYVEGQRDLEEDEFDDYQAHLNRILSTYGGERYASPTMASSSPKADTIVAMVSPTSNKYEMERSSVAEKRPEDVRPAVKEVTKERVSTSEPAKSNKRIPNPLDHPYAGMVAEDAKKYGVDPKVSLRLLNNETGGLKNPETAVSSAGAVGIAQFMPKTAGQYKIDPTDPKQSSDAMNRHVKHLMREYGDPQLVAIAYNWGEGNTNRWLKTGADPSRLPKETRKYLDKFMNTALAKGGEVQGYAGGGEIDAKSYTEKMKGAFGYEPFHGPTAKKYMSGGEVKHFQTGDFVSSDPMGMGSTEILDTEKSPSGLSAFQKFILRQTGNPEWKVQEANKKALEQDMKDKNIKPAPAVKPVGFPVPAKRPKGSNPPATLEQIKAGETKLEKQAKDAAADSAPPQNFTIATPSGITDALESLQEKPPVNAADNAPETLSEYDKLMQELREGKLASAKQRKEDKAYAMIMAGLATMGGESPNALTNIAKGQASGLGLLQENRKQSAAEDARIMQMQGTVLRYKDAALLAKEAAIDRKEYNRRLLELEKSKLNETKTYRQDQNEIRMEDQVRRKRADLQNGLNDYLKLEMAGIESEYKSRMTAAGKLVLPDEQAEAYAKAEEYLADARAKLERSPIVLDHRKTLYPDIDWNAVSPPLKKAIPLSELKPKK